jgi:hypothetical protein
MWATHGTNMRVWSTLNQVQLGGQNIISSLWLFYNYLMNKSHLKCEDWGFEVSEEE